MLEAEQLLRVGIFASLLLLFAGWEQWWPALGEVGGRARRWVDHLALSGVNTVLQVLVIPGGAVLLAGQTQHWDLLRLGQLPMVVTVLLTLVLLDLTLYLQHRLLHLVPLLWRFHLVHHVDPKLDVTTGIRFHPVEALLSAFVKLGAVALLGATPAVVIVFEVMLNATSLFNHANIALPPKLDQALRLFLVTPSMHRNHHLTDPLAQQHNFGFNLSLWDRLLGSYDSTTNAYQHPVGVTGYEHNVASLWAMLNMPLVKPSITTNR